MDRKPTYRELEERVKQLELSRSKDTLSKRDQYYNTLFEGASDSIFIMEDYRFIECNKMTLQMFGCERKEDILSFSPWKFSPSYQPDGRLSQEKAIEVMDAALQGNVQRFYWKHTRKDGTPFDAEVSLNLLEAGDKKLLQAIVRDITDRKKAEDALRQSERYLEEVVESSPVGIGVTDFEGNIFQLNQKFIELFGYTIEDIPTVSDWFPKAYPDKDYREKVVSIWNMDVMKAQETCSETPSREYKVTCKDGTIRHVEITMKPGKAKHLVIFFDITERKKAEEALKSEMDKLKTLVDGLASTNIGVDIVNIDYEVLQQNQILADRFGDIVGKKCYKEYMALEEPCNFCPMIKSLKNRKLERIELRAPDGRDYEILSAPLTNPDGTVDRAIEVVLDITRRKQSEKELLFKEDIIRSSSSIIATCDLEGKMTYGNPSFLKMWGFDDAKEFLGRHFSEFWEVKDRLDKIMEALQTEGKWFGEIQARRKDGTLFDVQVSAATVYDAEGNPIALTSTSTDITERMRTEEKLNILSLAVEQSYNSISILDTEGKTEYANPKLLETYKLGPEEVIGKNWRSFISEHSTLHRDFQEITDTVLGKGMPWKGEVSDRAKNGEPIWREALIFPIKNEKEKIVHAVYISEDISERKLAEEALRKSEEQLKFVLEGSQLGFWDWNIETDVVQRNERWAEMLGYTLKEIEFSVKQWTDLIHPDDRAAAWKSIQDHLDGISPVHEIEYRMLCKDGKYKWILDRAKIVKFDSRGQPARMSGTHTDFTEKKRAEAEREKLLNELQNALKEIKTLSGMLPICASCKKIRDDKGYWNKIEEYIETHSDASFSHSLCPECMDKIYGDEDWYKKKDYDK